MLDDRPWMHLIVKHPDGIMLFAVYTLDSGGLSSHNWQVISKYRGEEKDSDKIDAMAETHINALPANVFGLVTALVAIDLQTAFTELYEDGQVSVDYDSFPADGIVKLLDFITN